MLTGEVTVREVWTYCPKHEERIFKPQGLHNLIPPDSSHGLDLLLKAPMMRFLEGMSIATMQREIYMNTGALIPETTLSYLIDRGLAYIMTLHKEKLPALSDLFRRQGGYVLQLDGTTEGNEPVLFLARDGISHITLDARVLPSESEENIKPVLEDLGLHHGRPLTAIRDMSPGIRNAIDTVFEKLPQLECHFHVVRQMLRNCFEDLHVAMRERFRKLKTRKNIQAITRRLQPELGELAHDKAFVKSLVKEQKIPPSLPSEKLLPLVTMCIASWVLDYEKDLSGHGFPFDLPYLAWFERCKKGQAHARKWIQTMAKANKAYKPLLKLETLLKRITGTSPEGKELRRLAGESRRLVKVTDRIRSIFKLKSDADLLKKDARWQQEKVNAMKEKLEKYLEKLRCDGRGMDPKGIYRRKLGGMTTFLKNHWDFLFVPNPVVETGEGVRVIRLPRTNNLCESLFWTMERGLVRAKGQRGISGEMLRFGPGVALLQNLTNQTYIETVVGSWDEMLLAFARSDITGVRGAHKELLKGPFIGKALPIPEEAKLVLIEKGLELFEEAYIKA